MLNEALVAEASGSLWSVQMIQVHLEYIDTDIGIVIVIDTRIRGGLMKS